MADFFNVSEIVTSTINSKLPPDVISGMGLIITILKAIGILFVIYVIILIIRSISDILTSRRIKKMYIKINEMDEKLDIMLARQKTRVKLLKGKK